MTLVSFCLFVCNYLLFWCFLMFVLENSKHLIITSFLPRHFWFYGSLLCDLCVGKYGLYLVYVWSTTMCWYAWSIPWKLKNLSLLHLKNSSFLNASTYLFLYIGLYASWLIMEYRKGKLSIWVCGFAHKWTYNTQFIPFVFLMHWKTSF